MQLFDRTEPTPAQEALAAAEAESNEVLDRLYEVTARSFRQFWSGSVPAADMLAAMGARAASAFALHAATAQYLASVGRALPVEDSVPPVAFTIHNDGTITLD